MEEINRILNLIISNYKHSHNKNLPIREKDKSGYT